MYSEQTLRRQFFKAGRTGNCDVFLQAIKMAQDSNFSPFRCKYLFTNQLVLAVNQDPEDRNMLVLCLLNGHFQLLAETVGFMSSQEEQTIQHDIVKVIFNQKYDGLPAFIMALSLHPFTQYREKSERTLELLCDLANGDNSWAVNT